MHRAEPGDSRLQVGKTAPYEALRLDANAEFLI